MKNEENSIFGILKTRNGSYLLLFGKRKVQILKFYRNSFSYFKISASLL